jgi:hypothetical protein
MQIFVQLTTGRKLTLEVEGVHPVEYLRAMIQEETGVLPARQRLFFHDELGDYHTLTDGKPLSEYGLRKESTINMAARPRPRPVGVNAGGIRRTTFLHTLTAVRESKLCTMFRPLAQGGVAVSGAEEGEPVELELPQDADGDYVLDRDGECFGLVLDYLRDFDGAGDDRGAEPEPEAAVAEPPHIAALRAELATCSKVSALKQRAAAAGIGVQALSDADDAPDVKRCVIELIVAAAAGQTQISLPSSQDLLRRLLREAQYFELPELAAACREKLQGQIRSAGDRERLRSLLASQCAEDVEAEPRAAAVAWVEQQCGGDFTLTGLREQHQQIVDREILRDLMARGLRAFELQATHELSAHAAQALVTDWTGQYAEPRAVREITDEDARRLRLGGGDIEAIRRVPAVVPAKFTASHGSITLTEDGTLATYTGQGSWVKAVCADEHVVREGRAYVEYTVVALPSSTQIMVGIVPSSIAGQVQQAQGWYTVQAAGVHMYYANDGKDRNNNGAHAWANGAGQTYGLGDVIGLLLDIERGTLTGFKNGARLGDIATGLTGLAPFCWALDLHAPGNSVRIEAKPPPQ